MLFFVIQIRLFRNTVLVSRFYSKVTSRIYALNLSNMVNKCMKATTKCVKEKEEFQLHDFRIKWALKLSCLAFYNTAPSPSGPSGIHCDLKPDTDNTTRVTDSGAFIFSLFSPSALIRFQMISIDRTF